MADSAILISLNGASYTAYMKEEVDKYRIVVSGRTCIFERENDPRVLRYNGITSLPPQLPHNYPTTHNYPTIHNYPITHNYLMLFIRATSPGKLIRYLVSDGGHIDAGQPYAEIEVMKMVTHLHTSQCGK